MSRGLMIFALAENVADRLASESELTKFSAIVEQEGKMLANKMHMPIALDILLDLDTYFDQAEYPQDFRYRLLILEGWSIQLNNAETYPMMGWISSQTVKMAALKDRSWLDQIDKDEGGAIVEELLDDADCAADLGYGMIGIYQ